MTRKRHEDYMMRAIELAMKGWGKTSPNPIVGAVVVKAGRVIGEGYHKRAGSAHAEVNALRQAGARAKNATLYVTLEPCCHVGLTPPCTERIVKSGVKEVVIGTRDPNPIVDGRGMSALKAAGIKVRNGILRDACREINHALEVSLKKGRPYIILKAAMSLDGKIATGRGESRWITGEKCRAYVHRIRSGVDAIIVGRGTILADDPALSARLPGKKERNRLVVVLDEKLDLPKESRIFTRKPGELILATTKDAPKDRVAWARERGFEVIECTYSRLNRISLHYLMHELNKRRLITVLVEGGGQTFADFLGEGLVDRIVACIAPKIIGGAGKDAFPGLEIHSLHDTLQLKDVTVKTLGDDVVIEGCL